MTKNRRVVPGKGLRRACGFCGLVCVQHVSGGCNPARMKTRSAG